MRYLTILAVILAGCGPSRVCVRKEKQMVHHDAIHIKNCVANCTSMDLSQPAQYVEFTIPEHDDLEDVCVEWREVEDPNHPRVAVQKAR